MGGDSGNMGNVENVKRVVFVGNPNVGKSSMFNALLGARTRTMNAPGTTVSITCGQYRYKSSKTTKNPQNWQFVDTPGTYSLSPMSPDEQVAVDALTGASGMPVPDLAVVVLDATALSRSLYLLSMVVELGLPTVVALTMNDLAVRNGCGVDAERLSHLLDGMPVVAIDGRTGNGGKALADAIAASFEGTPVPHGLTALPTATADADMKTADGLSVWTAGILRGLDMHAVDHVTLSDRIDRVLLHPVIGVLVFLAVLFVVFQATTTLASPMQDWIDVTFRGWCADGLDLLLGLFGPSVSGGWLRSLLVDGLLDGVVTVLTFIPVMGIMFLLLSILEDSGYMARAAFVMDRAMRALGLDGRAFLPIIVGFGCNLPALAATRTLSDSRQRVLTGMLVPFAACSARLSVFLVLAHAFFPKYAGLVVFLMYVASVMVILLVGVLLRHTMFRGLEPEPLMLALPAYQCPRALQLARSVLLRLWGFIRGASVIIISMITALWLLQGIPVTANAGGFAHVDDVHDSAYGVLADAVAPVFAPAGFDDWHASAALITGFVAKEVVVGSMSQSYHADEPDDAASQQAGEGTLGQKLRASFDQSSHGHGKAAAIAFLLFTLAYTPCLATVAEMRRQFGTKVAARSVLLSLAVAYVIAIIAFQTLRLIW